MGYIWAAAAIAVAFAFGWIFGQSGALQQLGAFLTDTFSDSRTAAAVASAVFALLKLGSSRLGRQSSGCDWNATSRSVSHFR
jgi:hypothetical protein